MHSKVGPVVIHSVCNGCIGDGMCDCMVRQVAEARAMCSRVAEASVSSCVCAGCCKLLRILRVAAGCCGLLPGCCKLLQVV